MGLVRKANVDEEAPEVTAGQGGRDDMSGMIRRAVADEIERRRLEKLQQDEPDEAG